MGGSPAPLHPPGVVEQPLAIGQAGLPKELNDIAVAVRDADDLAADRHPPAAGPPRGMQHDRSAHTPRVARGRHLGIRTPPTAPARPGAGLRVSVQPDVRLVVRRPAAHRAGSLAT